MRYKVYRVFWYHITPLPRADNKKKKIIWGLPCSICNLKYENWCTYRSIFSMCIRAAHRRTLSLRLWRRAVLLCFGVGWTRKSQKKNVFQKVIGVCVKRPRKCTKKRIYFTFFPHWFFHSDFVCDGVSYGLGQGFGVGKWMFRLRLPTPEKKNSTPDSDSLKKIRLPTP